MDWTERKRGEGKERGVGLEGAKEQSDGADGNPWGELGHGLSGRRE